MDPDLTLMLTTAVLLASFWPISEMRRLYMSLHYHDRPRVLWWAVALSSPAILAALLALYAFMVAFGSYLTGENVTRALPVWPSLLGLPLLASAVVLTILADSRELIFRPLRRG